MLTVDELDHALKIARPAFGTLQKIYARLPDTRCDCQRPGECCRYLPQVTLVEALQWIDALRGMPGCTSGTLVWKFVEFYLSNPVRTTNCPFLSDGRCTIYPIRPFACRAYGLWSRQTGRFRADQSRREKQQLLEIWKKFGVNLPQESVIDEIDYCTRVRCCAQTIITDDQLTRLLEEVYELDEAVVDERQKFEDDCHSDFSFLIACLVFGPRKAILGKFAVVKELVQIDKTDRLRKMLDHIDTARNYLVSANSLH